MSGDAAGYPYFVEKHDEVYALTFVDFDPGVGTICFLSADEEQDCARECLYNAIHSCLIQGFGVPKPSNPREFHKIIRLDDLVVGSWTEVVAHFDSKCHSCEAGKQVSLQSVFPSVGSPHLPFRGLTETIPLSVQLKGYQKHQIERGYRKSDYILEKQIVDMVNRTALAKAMNSSNVVDLFVRSSSSKDVLAKALSKKKRHQKKKIVDYF